MTRREGVVELWTLPGLNQSAERRDRQVVWDGGAPLVPLRTGPIGLTVVDCASTERDPSLACFSQHLRARKAIHESRCPADHRQEQWAVKSCRIRLDALVHAERGEIFGR